MALDTEDPCPCGSRRTYGGCCEPIHRAGGAGLGTTAEQLMRARYTAYTLQNDAFIQDTWDPTTRRPASLGANTEWLGLEILDVIDGDGFASTGGVEFRAHYRQTSGAMVLHELSRFRRVDGTWLYVDGIVVSDPTGDG